MSDLVSRLAARIVGAATTTAGPRPVTRFGQETGFVEDDLATAVANDTPADPPVVVPVDATPVHRHTSPERIEPAPDAPYRQRRRDSQPAATEPDPVTVAGGDQTEGSRTAAAAASPAVAQVGREPTPEPGEARPAAANQRRNAQVATPAATPGDTRRAQPVAAAVPPAPTSPAPQPGRPPRSAPPAADHPGGGDGPVVQIHIGRLDVRAAPEPTGPPRHRPDPPEPRINLTDYLRGRREEP